MNFDFYKCEKGFSQTIKNETKELKALELFFDTHCQSTKKDEYFCSKAEKDIDLLKWRVQYLEMSQKLCDVYKKL